MFTDMNDRLDKFLQAEQLTPAKFADIIGVQRSSISHIISGRNKPSFDFIAKVLQRYPRLSPDWLILGKGDMYKQMVQASLFDPPTVKEPAAPQVSMVEPSLSSMDEPVAAPNNNGMPPSKPMSSNEEDAAYPIDMRLFDKEVERIVVFYKDRTFCSYTPSKE